MRFTFSSIKQKMVQYLSETSSFTKEVLNNSVYSSLLDIYAFITDKLAYYAEMLFTESSLKTAKNRRNIVSLTHLLNYNPSRKKGAAGRLRMTADSTFSNSAGTTYTGADVFIPRWSRFTNADKDLDVYSTEDVTYYNGTFIKNVYVNTSGTATNEGDGFVGIPVTAHGLPSGVTATISGSENYDGDYIIQTSSTTNKIIIEADFKAETFGASQTLVSVGNEYIPVKEGKPKTYTYTATGQVSEEITLYSDSIDNDEIQVRIINSTGGLIANVTITDEPYLINNTATYYAEVDNSNDFETIIIRFGDGIRTRRLRAGQIVEIKYAETKGSEGNIDNTNVITAFRVPPVAADGSTADVYIRNENAISDGEDIEDKESIRALSRQLFNAGYRAAANQDWEAILNSFSFVNKSKVWTDFDLGNFEVSSINNVVYFTAVSNSGDGLTTAQEAGIALDLKDKRDITTVIQAEDLSVVNLRLTINATVKNVPFADVKDTLKETLIENYGILNTDFAKNVYESNVFKLISEDENVIYHTTEIYHSEKSEVYSDIDATVASRKISVSNTASDESDAEKQVLIQDGTPEIWLKRKIDGTVKDEIKIAQCNAGDSTILEGVGNYTVTGGTGVVNYTTNAISYTIQDLNTDTVPSGEPTSSDPAVDFGVLNPTDSDDNGYWLRIVYKTKNGNNDFQNDIIFRKFFLISNIEDDDFTFNLDYQNG